jgi:uncharacterized protein YacL
MLNALIILIFVAAGAVTGFVGVELLPRQWLGGAELTNASRWVAMGICSLVSLPLGVLVSGTYRRLEQNIREMPTDSLVSRSVGLVGGLIIANLLLGPVFLLPFPSQLDFVKWLASLLASLLIGYLGMTLADSHGRGLLKRFNFPVRTLNANGEEEAASFFPQSHVLGKILDTSVIIDGRVEQLMSTGFLEGPIVVPCFVLEELQLISDSSDDEKRAKGRRGLDILNQLQAAYPDRLVLHDLDYPKLTTVDAKLVRLAQDGEAALVTNDFNLNKVASLQGVAVLNINELSKSLRARYIPGDLLQVRILKEGKEAHQGVAYLEDGTMVVIEEGKEHIGEQVDVIVTSALQTSAGKMIFARTHTRQLAT